MVARKYSKIIAINQNKEYFKNKVDCNYCKIENA